MARKRPRHKRRIINWDEDGIVTRLVGAAFALVIMLSAPLVHYVVVPLSRLWSRVKSVSPLGRPSSNGASE